MLSHTNKTLKLKHTDSMWDKTTHWSFGYSDFYLRSQGEQTFDERRLAHVASADETHLGIHTSCFILEILCYCYCANGEKLLIVCAGIFPDSST